MARHSDGQPVSGRANAQHPVNAVSRNGLGVAIGSREIRALLVRAGAIEWHASTAISAENEIAASLQELLMRAPRLTGRLRVTVVVSPTWVQVKPLMGLPPVKSIRLTEELLRENQQAFYLWNGSPALIAGIQVTSGGATWGAAFDRDVVQQVTGGLRAARLSVRRITPAVAAIVAAMANRPVLWTDGDDSFELEGDHGGMRRLNRITSNQALDASALPATLAEIGDDALRFADAYAAAVAPRSLALTLELQPDASRTLAWTRVRRGVTATVVCAAAAFAAFGPGMRAREFARAAELSLGRSRALEIELAQNESELRRITEILNRIESFRHEREKVTRILGDVAQAIPDSTAMLTFHVDSVEGAFTAIAPHVADVLPELAEVRGVIAPRIVGSVTREILGGAHVERASFRFRRPGQPLTIKKGVAR
jgi:hypothetical protein